MLGTNYNPPWMNNCGLIAAWWHGNAEESQLDTKQTSLESPNRNSSHHRGPAEWQDRGGLHSWESGIPAPRLSPTSPTQGRACCPELLPTFATADT